MSRARGGLGPLDGVSLIVGIVVGVSIFKVPALVFSNVSSPLQGLGVWGLGGLLALVGALCYAELAVAFPRIGGDYVYLSEAFGRRVGLVFGWASLTATLTGSIGVMAFVFSDYATDLFGISRSWSASIAVFAVLSLAVVNLVGLTFGKGAQNALSLLKLTALVVLAFAGFTAGDPEGGAAVLRAKAPIDGPGIGLAFILVMYAYGGWNDAAYVAAEVRDRSRNVPRVLIGGVLLVTLVYLLLNGAYLWALGFERLRASATPATDVLRLTLGASAGHAMSLVVMTSALGAINGLVLAGPRLYAAVGADHRAFRSLSRWNERQQVPVAAMLAVAGIAVALILGIGTNTGRGGIEFVVATVGLPPVPWESYDGGFGTLVSATAPVFWLFFLLTGLSLFVLRARRPDVARPFRVPFYPLPPLVFCGTSLWMLWASLAYAKGLALFGLVLLVPGILLAIRSPEEAAGKG